MANFTDVSNYISNHVLQSYVWDNSSITVRKKAVNRAELILLTILGDIFHDGNIPAEILGEQAVWVLKIDDTIERADFGMKNVWVDGTMITISDRDNSVNPLIYRMLGVSTTSKGLRRRVGGYHHPVGGTNRWGNKNLDRLKNRRTGGM